MRRKKESPTNRAQVKGEEKQSDVERNERRIQPFERVGKRDPIEPRDERTEYRRAHHYTDDDPNFSASTRFHRSLKHRAARFRF